MCMVIAIALLVACCFVEDNDKAHCLLVSALIFGLLSLISLFF